MSDFLTAFSLLFTPECLLVVLGGMLVGLILGAIPGLSGTIAITILMPVTFKMDPNMGIALLLAIWVGSTSGGFIGSILLGIPGTPSSVATCWDGYPMTKNGEVTRALSAGTVANFIGTVPSVVIAMIACPFIAKYAVKMGPWEYLALGFMAITMVVGISKGRIIKGLIAAAIGLLITCVGYAPTSAVPRFTFGTYYLAGGFKMMSVFIGIFAGTMILLNYAKSQKGVAGFKGKIGRFYLPLKDIKDNVVNIIRSFLIGLGIGFLPGMGAVLANVVSYTAAKNSSKHPEKFGKGCVDGVFAPEVANNACVGGAIIPMISLGIPGDGTTAMLLGGLVIHGIEAGPLLQKNEPVFVYMIFLACIFSGIMCLLFEMASLRQFPKLLKAPYHYLYPAILIIGILGVYVSTFNMFDVFACLGFIALGIWMEYADMPSTPFILAYILGPTLEANFLKAVSYARGDLTTFFTRPVSCLLLVVAVASVAWSPVKERITKKRAENV